VPAGSKLIIHAFTARPRCGDVEKEIASRSFHVESLLPRRGFGTAGRILSRVSQAQNERKPCTEWYREIPHQFCFLNLVRGQSPKSLLHEILELIGPFLISAVKPFCLPAIVPKGRRRVPFRG